MAEHALQTTITNPDLIGESVASAPAAVAPKRVVPDAKPADKHGWWWGTGRRKRAVARVRIRPAKESGKGTLLIQITNKKFKDIDTYFSEMWDRADARAPLELTDTVGKLDVFIRLHGGGHMGQAQAVRLGISRALVGYDPNFEAALRAAGYMTRDARKVERKKYGQPGARARFQFSKR